MIKKKIFNNLITITLILYVFILILAIMLKTFMVEDLYDGAENMCP